VRVTALSGEAAHHSSSPDETACNTIRTQVFALSLTR